MFNLATDIEIDKLLVVAQSNLPEAKEATEQLVTVLAPFISAIIQKVTRHGYISRNFPGYLQDLQQDACVALLESIQNYDNSRGAKFTTFAWNHIYHRLQSSLYNELGYKTVIDNSKSLFSSINDSRSDDDCRRVENFEIRVEENGYAEFDTQQIDYQVDEFLSNLPVRQRVYTRKVYWDSLSKSEVARRDNISAKMVEKVINQVYSKGRRHFHLNPYQG